jgi:exocyst complex component 5
MVTKDMTRYVEMVKAWRIDEEVNPALDVLLEVASLFVVGPEALREKLRGGTSSGGSSSTRTASSSRAGVGAGAGVTTGQTLSTGLSVQEVRAYVLRRDDVNSIGMQSVLNSL